MDPTDDDFGDLYVDDPKVQASDAFAGDVGFVKSCEESEFATNSGEDKGFEGTVKLDSEGEMKKFDVVAKDSSPCDDDCAVNLTEADEELEFSDSDSDDDLNIVLKDDDSKALPAACVFNTNYGGYEASKTCSFQRRWTRNASTNNAWSRTPFDVNFDVFEKKPWRNPGTDTSDFFNFGLNEQSWKDYCKPLGRAIEVGGGTLERIPSADLRRPRDSDPGVVIQIPVTNYVEELSVMTPERARCITSNEASGSDDSHSNDRKDLNSVDDSPKDEAFVGCQEKNAGSFSGEKSPPTENCCSREVTPSDKEMLDEEKEESFCNSDESDPSSVERESSLGDRIRLSPTPSCSAGKNEESDDYETESLKDSATDDQREVSTPPQQARLAEHEAISIKRIENSGTMHSRPRRSHEDSSKRHCGRAGYAGYVKDASPTPDPGRGKKVRSRHESLYRDSNKNWQNGPRITLERDETEGKGVHYYRENCHGRFFSSVDHAKHREHRFGWRNNKESSLGRGFDQSNSYKCGTHPKVYTSRSSFDLNQRNSRSSFREEDDRYGWHHCERKYGHERSPVRAYENYKERNGCNWLREPYYEDCIPITDMDYRYRSEYSSAHAIHNLNQSPENDLYCRRRGGYDYNLHRHRYEDGVHRAESRIPFDLAYREVRSFAEVEMREYQGYKRQEEFSEIEKRHHYTHDWNLDRFVSEKDDCKYRTQDGWSSPSLALRDSWYTKEAKGDSWRVDARDFRTAEAYDNQNNQFHKAAPRDGRTQNLGRSDNVSIKDRLKYDDDWVRPDRGRDNTADDIQCSMREVTYSEHPSYTDEILARDLRIPTHNRMAIKQRSRYFKSHIRENDESHHKSKKLRGDGHSFIKRQDPVDLAGRQGKRSNQSNKRFSNGEQQDLQKPRKLVGKSEEKAMQTRDINDKEEGEIIEEATNVKSVEIDNERIQESLKKMEKRRERFKGTKMARTVEATFKSETERRAKTEVTNQQRPVRKRRWCAS
ncbi:Pre-mRNA polyadenylation factor Fip1 domain [Arabidopsis thaliana x Arabidopsis arenosa]|uniref:Pre-mRNA polyadenylation factor Fip1 domain n=1 Tax=Arabidopsis thaliana x Arabidopsis arenosa TaxID=1240361 RepID=A0A8T2AQK2_9BRAS|nr:Pre-mRNA polyadenylation factor Fip1 domain [Arabidopsis thaliana x Arabidopsis arenosa]